MFRQYFGKIMPQPGLATQQHLLHWADTVAARVMLPRLVRRLILETGLGITTIDFPADEGTASGGWDGVVHAATESTFVPGGLSLWELSVNSGANAKAEDDYSKRDATPNGTPIADATYCQLILRRWTDRSDFAKTKGAEGKWLAVKAYGVDDVETWLESAPVTWAWISEQLGLQPYGMQTADGWWQAWAAATEPTLTTDVVLAERNPAAQDLVERLRSVPAITSVLADSRDEALAFIAASLLAEDEAGRGDLLARTAYVDEVGTWRALADHPHPLVLVTRTPEVIAEARSAPQHHVIVPMSTGRQADITIPPLGAREVAATLERLGLDHYKADEAGRLARRSLLALRRHLAVKPELHQPAWAQPPVSRDLRTILLANRWSDRDSDMDAIAQMAGISRDEFKERLAGLANDEDPLVDKVDRTWTLVSAFDAWLLLQHELTTDDLGRFRTLVLDALLEPDPFADMTDAERLRAQFGGLSRAHSPELRDGLATSLALLGTHGAAVDLGGGATAATWAVAIVQQLLKAANDAGDISVWTSLAPVLPQLAEAAPDEFLAAVRVGTRGDAPVLAGIFQDSKDGAAFGANSPHSALLWGLEAIAWSADHFGAAVDALARLDEIDPGGRLANRPFGSLKSIFCGWHPDNSSSWDGRLASIDGLRQRHPDIAWRLMLQLLPGYAGFHDPTYSPRFRDWRKGDPAIPQVEYAAYIKAIVKRLTEDVGDDAKRWQELLSHCADLGPDERAELRAVLTKTVSTGALSRDDKTTIWQALRDLTTKHREFSDATWALPEEDVAAYEQIAASIQPEDAADASAWLFAEHMPDLGSGPSRRERADYHTALTERRRDAVREMLAAGGVELVRATARASVVPAQVGVALADASNGTYDDEVYQLLESAEASDLALAEGFLARRFYADGWEFVDALRARHPDVDPVVRARLLLSTGDFPRAWEIAEEDGEDTQIAFWTSWPTWGLPSSSPQVVTALRGLLSVDRCAAALDMAGMHIYSSEGDPSLVGVICDGLEAFLSLDTPDPEIDLMSAHDFEHLFEYLERHRDLVGSETLGRLEWAFLPTLGYEPSAPSLHATLAEDPQFFIDVMKVIYRGSAEPPSVEPDEAAQAIALNGYRLLSSWRGVPGLDGDVINYDALRSWVDRVMEGLSAADRMGPAESAIGEMLASAPADADGRWPPLAVRDLLEELQSDGVENGITTAVYNRRGVTMRDLEAGGAQERGIAERYGAQAVEVADGWPRTAALLRSLAESYERDARQFDSEAERRRQGID